jgi:hypothetical protein
MGLTSSRHAHLKFTVIDAIKRLWPPTANVHDFEPLPAQFGYPLQQAAADALAAAKLTTPDAQPLRADIAVTTNGITKILDTVISHPTAVRNPSVATVPGFAANAAHIKKVTLYSKTYDIPSGHMVPLSAETGGRLHDCFKAYIKDVVSAGLAVGGATEPVWTLACNSGTVLLSSPFRNCGAQCRKCSHPRVNSHWALWPVTDGPRRRTRGTCGCLRAPAYSTERILPAPPGSSTRSVAVGVERLSLSPDLYRSDFCSAHNLKRVGTLLALLRFADKDVYLSRCKWIVVIAA